MLIKAVLKTAALISCLYKGENAKIFNKAVEKKKKRVQITKRKNKS